MDFSKARWIIREALFTQHRTLPTIGSNIAEYEIASVAIMKALDDAGYLVVRKPKH